MPAVGYVFNLDRHQKRQIIGLTRFALFFLYLSPMFSWALVMIVQDLEAGLEATSSNACIEEIHANLLSNMLNRKKAVE